MSKQAEPPRERPKVGVGVFVTSEDHPNCVLVGIRKGSSGSGKYALPGGHLEFGEEWDECAIRETEEETGIRLKNVKTVTVMNCTVPEENYHYIDIFMQGEVDTTILREPKNMEPEKCEGWEWLHWDDKIPLDRCFKPLQMFIQNCNNPFKTKLH
ncbi:8-oxo-dGTP diphosphatase [Mytilus galloprovincialis]|uniref:Nucleotide triphosphate diphosphatase NUDT15 n=1 Tax=Mytilus galloprovincialis TaxID=29158 RepID=A0A8B6EGA5_MYTGA|nr:8-oxo-dGTP diphosphatase [Mytilus galloprovincialis]